MSNPVSVSQATLSPNEASYTDLVKWIRARFLQEEAGLVPLHAPCFDATEKDVLNDCIDSTFVSSVGRYVDEFERQCAEFTGAQHAVAVVNGTLGLFLALKVVGVEPGDLVLTQSLTFVATPNAIKMHQADPVFLDVSEKTMGLSAEQLAAFLDSETYLQNGQCYHRETQRRISACVPMHTLGFPAEIERIVELCHEHHIKVVEDAAESLGSFLHGRHTGTFGDIGVFSFNGNKVLTTGGGGMLVTHHEAYARQAKHLSTTAKQPHSWLFEHDQIGYNLRMPNLNAALGVAQMEKLTRFLQLKATLAADYHAFTQAHPCLVDFQPEEGEPNYWLNALLLENEAERDFFLAYANEHDVQVRPLWTPMHRLEIYRHEIRMPMTQTEFFADRLVNLPSGVVCSQWQAMSETSGV